MVFLLRAILPRRHPQNLLETVAEIARAVETDTVTDPGNRQIGAKKYLGFISSFDDHSGGNRNLIKVTSPVLENERSYRGLTFLLCVKFISNSPYSGNIGGIISCGI